MSELGVELERRYEIVRPLGVGGAGEVFLARERETGQQVALKLLRGGPERSPAAFARFRREAAALARLEHPHIVRLIDTVDTGDELAVALEYVPGRSLEDLLAAGETLPPAKVVELGIELGSALAHAHGRGLLHRDLKPGNVLLGPGDVAKLTDYGLARELGPSQGHTQLTRDGQMLGSPGYWSPEQALGQWDQVGPQSDVYGLAATLYAALTGAPPHGQPESLQQALANTERLPAPPSKHCRGVPPELDRILLAALEPDTGQRTAHVRELVEQLLASRRGLRRIQSSGGSGRWILLAGVVLAMGGGALAQAWSRRRQGPQPGAVASTIQTAGPTPEPSPAASGEPGAPPLTGSERLNQANYERQRGNLLGAQDLIERELEQDPGNVAARRLRVWIMRQLFSPKQELEHELRWLLAHGGEDLELRLQLAEALPGSEAPRELLVASQRFPGTPLPYLYAAQVYCEQGPKRAQALLSRGLPDVTEPEHLRVATLTLLRLGLEERAIDFGQRATSAEPERAHTYYLLGEAHLRLASKIGATSPDRARSQAEQASQAFAAALRRNPLLIRALVRRARAEAALGHHSVGARHLAAAGELLPDSPRVRAEAEEQIKVLRMTIERYPELAARLEPLEASLLTLAGQATAAYERIRELAEASPQDDSLRRLALLFGDVSGLRPLRRADLDPLPGEPPGETFSFLVRACKRLLDRRDPLASQALARARLLTAEARLPLGASVQLVVSEARLATQRGDHEAAAKAWGEVIRFAEEQDQRAPRALLGRATALHGLGRTAEAARDLESMRHWVLRPVDDQPFRQRYLELFRAIGRAEQRPGR